MSETSLLFPRFLGYTDFWLYFKSASFCGNVFVPARRDRRYNATKEPVAQLGVGGGAGYESLKNARYWFNRQKFIPKYAL